MLTIEYDKSNRVWKSSLQSSKKILSENKFDNHVHSFNSIGNK